MKTHICNGGATKEFILRHGAGRLAPLIIALFFAMLPAGLWAQDCASTAVEAGYHDYNYGTTVQDELTAEKPESKLWHNDGTWWGVLWVPGSNKYRIHRFDRDKECFVNEGPDVDDRTNARADVLWDGQYLYVSSHAKGSGSSDDSAYLLRYSYHSSSKSHSLDSGFPVTIHNDNTEASTITKDSSGQLWAAWTASGDVMVNRTLGDDKTWGTPFVLPTMGGSPSSDDVAGIVAFAQDKIGVLWSNQSEKRINFAVHKDASADTDWEPREDALYEPSLGSVADDHINMAFKRSTGELIAITKSSIGDPAVFLLKRHSNGQWSWTSFGGESYTRPIVLMNTDNDSIYAISKAKTSPVKVYYKSTHLSNPVFDQGIGKVLIADDNSTKINNPTSTKQPVTAATGLLILASDKYTQDYYHRFLDISSGGGPSPTPTQYDLSVSTDGNGSVNPNGGTYNDGTNVQLTANPASGWSFSEWQGDASGSSSTTTITMDDHKSVTAKFIEDSVPEPPPAIPPGGGTSFAPIADAYVKIGSSKNYGDKPILRNKTSSSVYHSYLKFQVAGLNGTVESAILRIYVEDPGDGGTMPLYSASNEASDGSGPWTENSVTGVNQPAAGSSPLAFSSTLASGTWATFDITGAITGNGDFSFCLNTPLSNSIYMSSKEGANPPELIIGTGTGSAPPTQYDLTTLVQGQGNVTPYGGSYDEGTQLQLTATPADGWQFDGWQNDLGGDTNPADLTMNSNKNVTAVFSEIPVAPIQYDLTISVEGQGGVSPSGGSYDEGTQLQLTATPADGWQFDGWQNDLSGSNSPADLTMDGNKNITAVFVQSLPAGTTTFHTIADAHIKEGSSKNRGAESAIRVKTSSSIYHGYLQFDVAGLTGSPVSAKLRLFVTDQGDVGPISVYGVANTYQGSVTIWEELGINASNAPAIGSSPLATLTSYGEGTWAEIDVTTAIAGNGKYSFALTSETSDSKRFSSKEGSNAPQLVIETSSPLPKMATTYFPPAENLTAALPTDFVLQQNYPNPFNPSTTIRYQLPEATHVRLVIYDAVGRILSVLVNEIRPAGLHFDTWHARNGIGQPLPSGTYFYRITAGHYNATGKMMLVR